MAPWAYFSGYGDEPAKIGLFGGCIFSATLACMMMGIVGRWEWRHGKGGFAGYKKYLDHTRLSDGFGCPWRSGKDTEGTYRERIRYVSCFTRRYVQTFSLGTYKNN